MHDFNSQAVADKLMRLRAERGWSQSAAAENCGMSRNGYMSVEQGFVKNPRLQTLQKIASAYDVSYEDLIGYGTPTSVDKSPDDEFERKYRKLFEYLNELKVAHDKALAAKK